MAKKSKSPLVEDARKLKDEFKGYVLTSDEQEQYSRIIERISDARSSRETPRDEWDGMSYEQVYLSNKRAAMSYLTPKRNDSEVRINTGTTEKRIELVMNELLGMNLEEEVEAFDKNDNLAKETSQVFTDVVRRTEQIEMSRDKDIFIYQELLTQPSVFVEELWTKEKVSNSSKKGFRERHRCDRRLIQGVQVYLGDINLPDTRFNEQPFIVKYARMNKTEAELLFKNLNPEKWKAVRPGAYKSVGGISTHLYRTNSLDKNEVEAFWYMSYPDNELQIIVNGIPFLEVGAKYTEEYGEFNGYHMTMVSLKPYSGDFAYGKPLTQSSKTLQALNNETIRNLIRKFRQALEPPMGTPAGKMYSRDIWNPGHIVQGVKKDDFQKLIDHQGVTQSEMAMFDLIEKKTNEFIGTSQTEPLQGKSSVTATELRLAQQNAIKMLGNSVLACMRLKERLAILRVKNILLNYTKPVGKEFDAITNEVKDVYARFSIADADIGGQSGERVIQFGEKSLNRAETDMLFQSERELKKRGRNVEYKVVNVNKLKDLELYFYVNVVSKPRESNDLDKALMTEMINQGAMITQLTGRPMSSNKLIDKFERIYEERDLFEKEAPQSLGQMNEQMGQISQTPGMQNMGAKAPERPSVNTMENTI